MTPPCREDSHWERSGAGRERERKAEFVRRFLIRGSRAHVVYAAAVRTYMHTSEASFLVRCCAIVSRKKKKDLLSAGWRKVRMRWSECGVRRFSNTVSGIEGEQAGIRARETESIPLPSPLSNPFHSEAAKP